MVQRAVLPLLLLCGWPGGGVRRRQDGKVTLSGTVFIGGTEQRGDVLKGATVTVTRASDGLSLGNATSASAGDWRSVFAAEADTRVVVGFAAPGFVPNFRAMR